MLEYGWRWVGRRVKDAARCGVKNGGVAGARGGAGEGLAAVGRGYVGGVSVWRRGVLHWKCEEAARRMALTTWRTRERPFENL